MKSTFPPRHAYEQFSKLVELLPTFYRTPFPFPPRSTSSQSAYPSGSSIKGSRSSLGESVASELTDRRLAASSPAFINLPPSPFPDPPPTLLCRRGGRDGAASSSLSPPTVHSVSLAPGPPSPASTSPPPI